MYDQQVNTSRFMYDKIVLGEKFINLFTNKFIYMLTSRGVYSYLF